MENFLIPIGFILAGALFYFLGVNGVIPMAHTDIETMDGIQSFVDKNRKTLNIIGSIVFLGIIIATIVEFYNQR